MELRLSEGCTHLLCPPKNGCQSLENSVTFQSYFSWTIFFKLFLFHLTILSPSFHFILLCSVLLLLLTPVLPALSCCICPESTGHTHTHKLIEHRGRKSILTKKEVDKTDTAADRIVNLTENGSAQPAAPPATPSPLSLFFLSFCQCLPPPPFLFFPWNPFHIIKDTQMKWTLRKSGFQQGGGCGGGGG